MGLGIELRVLEKTLGEERYALHRLVREVRREDVPLDGREDWISTICHCIGEWFQQRRQEFADLVPFEAEIDHLRNRQEHSSRYSPKFASRLTWLQGYPPYHQGRYRESKVWVERAMDLFQQAGLDDKGLEGHLLDDLGATSSAAGEERPALQYAEKSLEVRLGWGKSRRHCCVAEHFGGTVPSFG